ncbi:MULTISPECIES: amino acid ABC transporter ATP-binding protein [Bacilli]|uniref:amino acid ABC transporter ATP-binding protein n=1 Tax=Bacilli TaxID=91061 RepID=UPI00061CA7DA|nr:MULTISPECIES: amino acid ABC transporter ATP-binding protein [Bacilli]AVL76309.1 amino acid ABC transporter ATP-binding protein [Staphylococcus cohnii]MBL0377308.1 amino acid ABC transporter ATP-binding protein [Staphylococcus sp. S75]MBL0382637.1 amino acid ABC transporter ATP-binding protein [Staphylococcus sp. S59]MBL0400927.1 amino acid ABC transporter ATP-binding protein [Staphylococcus sp. S36]MCT1915625.1 amino acid ABC transporter ATP-binding protein [Staphylococcus ureilyticus]
MIKIEHLKKSFGNTEVLKDINLELNQGEVLAIIGPSGSGKSTLLRCLNWLEQPDSGTIAINDIEVQANKINKKNKAALIKQSSMVFQHYNLFKNKTVFQNVALGLKADKKVDKSIIEQRVNTYIEKVGLEKFKEKYPATLSGGQQQRVGIARSLALDTPLLLFDEPTSALDPELVTGVLNIIKDVANLNKTLIIVTHEMSFAEDIADQVIFMENGYIVESGSSKQIFHSPKHDRTDAFVNNKTISNSATEGDLLSET